MIRGRKLKSLAILYNIVMGFVVIFYRLKKGNESTDNAESTDDDTILSDGKEMTTSKSEQVQLTSLPEGAQDEPQMTQIKDEETRKETPEIKSTKKTTAKKTRVAPAESTDKGNKTAQPVSPSLFIVTPQEKTEAKSVEKRRASKGRVKLKASQNKSSESKTMSTDDKTV